MQFQRYSYYSGCNSTAPGWIVCYSLRRASRATAISVVQALRTAIFVVLVPLGWVSAFRLDMMLQSLGGSNATALGFLVIQPLYFSLVVLVLQT